MSHWWMGCYAFRCFASFVVILFLKIPCWRSDHHLPEKMKINIGSEKMQKSE